MFVGEARFLFSKRSVKALVVMVLQLPLSKLNVLTSLRKRIGLDDNFVRAYLPDECNL